MTAKGRARGPDAMVVRPLARRLKLQNGANVTRLGTRRYRKSQDKNAASPKADTKFARRKSRLEHLRQSQKRISDQKVSANSFPAEKSLKLHQKGEESFDGNGICSIPNDDNSSVDKHALSPKKVSDRKAEDEDYGFWGVRREEGQGCDFSRFKESISGSNKKRGSVGWSVLIKGPEHAEISKTDEDDMLRLSQPSTSEEPVSKGETSEVDASPSRKRMPKNEVVKRPRPCRAKRGLSNHICEIMNPTSQYPEGLQVVQRPATDSESKQVRGTSLARCNVNDKEASSPELPKKVENIQKLETALTEKDATKDRDKLRHISGKSLSPSKTQKNSAIILNGMGVPGHKRRKNEEQQYRDNKRNVRATTHLSDPRNFSTSNVMQREEEVLKTRNSNIDIQEDVPRGKPSQIVWEQQYAKLRHTRGQLLDGERDELAKPKDDAAHLSASARTEGNAIAVEDSPQRCGQKSKQRWNCVPVRNESAAQTLSLPTGEDGYSMSKKTMEIGLLVRKRLLAGREKIDELETSKESSSTANSSNSGESSGDAGSQPNSLLDSREDTQHLQTVENLHTEVANEPKRRPKRPRTICEAETERERRTQNAHNERNLTRGLTTEQAVVNLPSIRSDRVNVQAEVEDCCLRLSGSRHIAAMEVEAHILGCSSREPDDRMKTTRAVSFDASQLRDSDCLKLEETENTKHFDVKALGGESEPRSKKPEHSSSRDEELSIPGSILGDMSDRNHLRVHKRKQSETRETVTVLLTDRSKPLQNQNKTPRTKKNTKTHAPPSSVVKIIQKCQPTTRSAAKSNPTEVSAKVLGQPAIAQPGDEERSDFVEAVEMSNNVDISIENSEGTKKFGTVENRSKRIQSPQPCLRKEFEIEPSLDEISQVVVIMQRPTNETNILNQIEKEYSESASLAKTSIEQNLDDLVDHKKLKEQSKLLTRRSKRSRRSCIGGARRDRSVKALDELSDNEDSKDKAWVPRASSSAQQRSETSQVPKVPPQKTHSMKTRGRRSTLSRATDEPPTIIDLTDIGDDENTVPGTGGTEDDDDIAESLQELQRLNLEDKTKGLNERPGCKYLSPLSDDESKLAVDLTTRTKRDTKIVVIAEAGITLRGESFKRLRGTRWLDDEVLNAYVSLINSRNNAVFREMDEHHRTGIPRTYVFNTYFFTRLCSGPSGFDYPGVKGWTKRAKVDILNRDLVLIPINLGNHHWVLSGVDMEHKEIMYLDSMHGPDRVGAISKLKRWVFEELRHKHGEEIATQLDPSSWKAVKHSYRVRRVGVLPEKLESSDAIAGRISRVPRQTDGGSCGVFTAKMADCISMGIKIYFKQKDIQLIRRRMALDLFRGYVPL